MFLVGDGVQGFTFPWEQSSETFLSSPMQKSTCVLGLQEKKSIKSLGTNAQVCVCVCVCVESCFSPHDDFLETFPVNDLSNAGDESALEL